MTEPPPGAATPILPGFGADAPALHSLLTRGYKTQRDYRKPVSDLFVDVNKMVSLGFGSEREIEDIMITRYACYLIARNGDPRTRPCKPAGNRG